MTELVKPNYRKTHVMSASHIHNYRPKQTARIQRAISPFVRYLNTGTLAFGLVIALALLTGLRSNEAETKGSAPPTNTKSEVVSDNFSFLPQTFAAPLGATVIWTNQDSAADLVIRADNQFTESPVLAARQGFSNTFATPGTYSYFCSIQPSKTGQFIVK
jgi:plastocyanin